MAVKPLEDGVSVKPNGQESVTSSGLYRPESAKERPVQGTVIAVGPGKRLDNGKRSEMAVKKGDTVVLKYNPDAEPILARAEQVAKGVDGAGGCETVPNT